MHVFGCKICGGGYKGGRGVGAGYKGGRGEEEESTAYIMGHHRQ